MQNASIISPTKTVLITTSSNKNQNVNCKEKINSLENIIKRNSTWNNEQSSIYEHCLKNEVNTNQTEIYNEILTSSCEEKSKNFFNNLSTGTVTQKEKQEFLACNDFDSLPDYSLLPFYLFFTVLLTVFITGFISWLILRD